MELMVQERTTFGRAVKFLRRKGFIPAELYGAGTENLHLSVPARDFEKVFRAAGENTLVDIVVGGKRRQVVIHEISRNPVTDEVLSVDFYQVRLDEKMKVKVPIVFTGEAPAVKEKGGVLVKAMHEVEIECLPANIPHSIEVELSGLTSIGACLYVRDFLVGPEVTLHVSPEAVIATVKEKAAEEIPAAPEVNVESVKVETEEKKAERAAKKEAAPGEVEKKPEAHGKTPSKP